MCHSDTQVGHQGVKRTFAQLQAECYWVGVFRSTELQCVFSGYVMFKPTAGTTALEVAQAYEEVVFRRFGASSSILHDQDPRFMSEVFREFREMMGSRKRATLAYRPQTNRQLERLVQTAIQSVQSYVEHPGLGNWNEVVKKLMWLINTSLDSTRKETPFFLVHGWDPKNTISAMLTPVPRGRRSEERVPVRSQSAAPVRVQHSVDQEPPGPSQASQG
ncbi:hypothetical protein PybrP1_003182 [[Pythium] brassicae (nom. inval.)]|nr:hypothetical protein PybrP1_003182 [[Pythium] brassicae (nom. inval.)]